MEKLYLWENEVPLWDDAIKEQDKPSITPYLLEGDEARGAVIICPGGAYVQKVDHEKKPIADSMNRMGLHAFVLDYRVTPYHWPAPLLDVQRAVRYIRANAKALRVKADKIAVIGFSAGGHLAGMSGVVFDGGNAQSPDPIERVSCRPDAFIPCYAVLSMQAPYGHQGSITNITGSLTDAPRELTAYNRVTKDTPPCFLFHTAFDDLVPVENSLLMAKALHENNVPFSLHVFPHGGHGISMGETTPLANAFPGLLEAFLKDFGF